MKFIKIFIVAIICTFCFSCANQIKEEDRLEQVYPYSSIHYIGYSENDVSGERNVYGNLEFQKSNIVMNIEGQDASSETIYIRTVTYDDDPNKIEYRTNEGDFVVNVRNDTITEVTLYTGQFLSTFNKAQLVNKPIPAPLDNPVKGWKRIQISDVGTIDLAPELEIQGGKFQELKETVYQYYKIEFDDQKLTLQPKGVNVLNNRSLKNYIRIMLETIDGNLGDFDRINEKLIFSEDELSELNNDFRNQINQGFRGTNLKLIEWYDTEVIDLNNMPAIKISYKRQLKEEPHVIVQIFRIQNNDRMHSLTVSYRESEKALWENIITQTLNSFRVTEIY